MYIVFDTTGNQISKPFKLYKDAYNFKVLNQRFDWVIKQTTFNN